LGRKAHGPGRPTAAKSVKNPKTQLEAIDISRRSIDISEKPSTFRRKACSTFPRKGDRRRHLTRKSIPSKEKVRIDIPQVSMFDIPRKRG